MGPTSRRVADAGLLAVFTKYRKSHKIREDREDREDRASKTTLVCLHHYDQVVLYPNITRASQVHDITGRTVPDAVASKWMLTFRMEGEGTPGFDICAWAPLYYLVLLRANRSLLPTPTLDLEALAAGYLRRNASAALNWALYRTFVPREMLLVLSSKSWNELERMQRRLQRTAVRSGERILPVFDFVESWPCVRQAIWSAAVLDASKPEDEAILNEPVVGCRALRVHGNCQKDDGLRYECCRHLDRRVLKRTTGATVALSSRRPITGVGQDREVDRPASTVRDLLGDIRLLRHQCADTDASCSVYLSRTALDADEIHARATPSALSSTTPAPGLQTDFVSAGVSSEVLVLPNASPMTSDCDMSALAAIRRAPGSATIAVQLERVRDALVHSLNNTYVAPEFLDLAGYLGLFEEIEKDYDYWERNPPEQQDELVQRRAWLQAIARDVAEYLGHAVRERNRDDISGLSHHRHSAPLGASGFSRLAAVGGFAVEKTLSRLPGASGNKSFLTPRLCVLGKEPDYLELGRVPILNAPARAMLEPQFYFGLGVVAGYIFWRRQPWAAGLSASDRQHMAECLADGFCLNVVFCGNVERYLHAWVAHSLEMLEREYMSAVYDTAGAVHPDSQDNKFLEVAGRLIIVATVGYLQKGFPMADARTKAMATVNEVINDELGKCPSKLCGTVARAVRRKVEDLQAGGPKVQGILDSNAGLAGRVRKAVDEFQVEVSIEPTECVTAWKRGQIVEEPIDHPLAALALLAPCDGAHAVDGTNITAQDVHEEEPATEWARNIAAILSFGVWQEKAEKLPLLAGSC